MEGDLIDIGSTFKLNKKCLTEIETHDTFEYCNIIFEPRWSIVVECVRSR